MTLYDAVIILIGVACTVGAIIAARQMSPANVRYVGLARSGRIGAKARGSDEGIWANALSKDFYSVWADYAARSAETHKIADEITALDADQIDYLWRDQWLRSRGRDVTFLHGVEEERYKLVISAPGTGKALLAQHILELVATDEARPKLQELQMLAKQSKVLEEQDRKIRDLERRIRQLEEKPEHELTDVHERHARQTISKAVH